MIHFIEFTSFANHHHHHSHAHQNGHHNHHRGPSTATDLDHLLECPDSLSLCYVHVHSAEVARNIVHLVNEAKHLQEERKFEVDIAAN